MTREPVDAVLDFHDYPPFCELVELLRDTSTDDASSLVETGQIQGLDKVSYSCLSTKFDQKLQHLLLVHRGIVLGVMVDRKAE